jgi:putative transposase
VALGVMRDFQVSQRRACVLIGVDPKTVGRERPPDHGAIREAMRGIAGQRRRFGYRRIGVMLERKGMSMNHKKLYRLYGKKSCLCANDAAASVLGAVGRQCREHFALVTAGRWTLSRIRLAHRANSGFWRSTMIAAGRTCAWLRTPVSRVLGWRANWMRWCACWKPACIVSENGTEFTSRAILDWAGKNRV